MQRLTNEHIFFKETPNWTNEIASLQKIAYAHCITQQYHLQPVHISASVDLAAAANCQSAGSPDGCLNIDAQCVWAQCYSSIRCCRACIYIHIFIYSKTSLNRQTIGLALNGPFREVVLLWS